ncbi:MAG: NTP transferase domain-containing protein [Planctomycetes bacterium]|nr:NTP transferase domain-containing protein [Planctomycetota bacterium]
MILAGGKGTRLAPYTTVFPKPMMPVGDLPILEIVLCQLRHYGFRNVVISVGHLAELLRAFFGDGSKWGLNIRYVTEDQPLGTMGPLKLVSGLTKPFIVMNGDLLTDIDYSTLYDYHQSHGHEATVSVVPRTIQVSLGVLEYDVTQQLTGFREKPTTTYHASMGIYVFNPSILGLIPEGKYYGFDHLMLDMLAARRTVKVRPFDGLWLDIGRPEDYAVANETMQNQRGRLLPGGGGTGAN